MSYRIQVVNRRAGYRLNRHRLETVARHVLRAEKAPPAEIEIAVVSDAEIARINWRFLRHRGATDVITFDLADEGEKGIIGQIVVSVDTAKRQADCRGHSVFAELAFYVAHGLLHLVGHDDRSGAHRRRMLERQGEILAALGIHVRM